ncbi:MAG TPA: LLM class flavin-dependent oxidoreductase [Pseudomonadales bacterium]|jgi:alkanesulfonate monooxygenase SsuD/methylene tetrahydromethanopterin reductase-like flavin-dependent oxidoreductase (luciferase family)
MRHGIIFSGGGTSMQQMVDLACQAEQAGVDSIYLTEAWRSGFVGLAAIAAATDRVEIGPYILNAYARSVWVTAMSAVDLDELSGGRLVLGVGSGNKHINEDWQGIPQARPIRKMDEYVTLLRKAVSTRLGETLEWEGELHRMNWPPAVAPLRSTIPVYLAALYPQMIGVAGRVADGLALGALLSADYIGQELKPRFGKAAADADRDPDSLGIYFAPFVSVGEEAEAARNAARAAICHLYSPLPHPYYDHVLREQGFAEAADACAAHVPEGRLEHAMEAISDEMLDTVAVAGTAAQCRAALDQFEGIVDQALLVNVNYSGESEETLLAGFQDLIRLAGIAGSY